MGGRQKSPGRNGKATARACVCVTASGFMSQQQQDTRQGLLNGYGAALRLYLTRALCSRESTFLIRHRSRILTLFLGHRLAILGAFSATSHWGAAIVIPPSERILAWIVRALGLLRHTAIAP